MTRAYLEVRLTPEEKAMIDDAARKHRLSVSDWVRINMTAVSSSPPKMSVFGANFRGTTE